MGKSPTRIVLGITGAAFIVAGVVYFRTSHGPGVRVPLGSEGGNGDGNSEIPLMLPKGFSVSLFADGLPNVRVMARDSLGNMWVSQTKEGIVALLEVQDGKVVNELPVFRNLRKPHGLAFDPKDPFLLYIAEEHRISKVRVYSEGEPEKIADLPSGGGHFTRTIEFGPDDALYVSIGSSCDVCDESDPRRAKILRMNRDGGNMEVYASGLRNAVFFAWNPLDGKMWATEMGRDFLGDELPPEEINIIEEGKDYGWPVCYGKNIHDTEFDKKTYVRDPCAEPFKAPSYIDMPAHSAPLGLAFVKNEGWPQEYLHDLIVAYHGSWNRTQPTGYKLVRIPLNAEGKQDGPIQDFATGWMKDAQLGEQAVWGRPVAIMIEPGGVMYVSDDKAGAIYTIGYTGSAPSDSPPDRTIRVASPKANEIVRSPLRVAGEARGTWYFEASFPVSLFDANGKRLVAAPAQAKGEWMTTDFVPFEAELRFSEPSTSTGFLLLREDDPSGGEGGPVEEVRIPVRFK